MSEWDERTDWADTKANAFSSDSAAPGYDNAYDEEYAAEISDVPLTNMPRRVIHARPDIALDDEDTSADRHVADRSERRQVAKTSAGLWGTIGLIAAIASWFVWPALFATVGIGAGFVAIAKGKRAIGAWSVALGLISLTFMLLSSF